MAHDKIQNLENFFLNAEHEEENYTLEDFEDFLDLIVEEEDKMFEKVTQEIENNYLNYSIEEFKKKLEQLHIISEEYRYRKNELIEKIIHLYEQEGNEIEEWQDSINASIQENQSLETRWILQHNSFIEKLNQKIYVRNEMEREFRNREQWAQRAQENNENER